MTAFLLDVNVLLALAWREHQFHSTTQEWFARNADRGWATCPLVEAGFVRIISNPQFSPRAVSPQEAIDALAISVGHPKHQFWADAVPVTDGLARFANRIVGHKQVTDAYLLALARHHRGKLATLDRRVCSLVERSEESKLIEMIE
jgi:toxin-antitoxin system PIN domain toxin